MQHSPKGDEIESVWVPIPGEDNLCEYLDHAVDMEFDYNSTSTFTFLNCIIGI